MKFLILVVSILALSSCTSKFENTVANAEDYNAYLSIDAPKTTSKYFELWQKKIRPDSTQLTSFGIVAGEYTKYFKRTGAISFLKKAEQSLRKAVAIAATGKEGYARALARNYISQHRFKEALSMATMARTLGGGLQESQKLLFDVHMELGNYTSAKKYLDSVKNVSDFGYLIRASKWNDYKGDLPTTIKFMERAKEKAIAAKNNELKLWSYTNLADYYGHAGRIQEAYDHYLKALKIDALNAYAKRGIAWIAFSHDKNPKEALRILETITENYKAPDYDLFKAEIAEFMGQEDIKAMHIADYFEKIKNPHYGTMYHGYSIPLYLENPKTYSRALELAKEEVANRPTPESYSWLAYSYLKQGDKHQAKEIIDSHVIGKTHEPVMLFHTAQVYKAHGDLEKVHLLKEELADAFFEVGPAMEREILAL